jgi:dTDP-L-rhamnose 4-epimerase
VKALILGGAGFVGSHLADTLVKRGYQVRVLDNLELRAHPDGFPTNVGHDIRLLKGDIRDRAAMETALDGADVVFHQAEYSGRSSDYAKYFHSNAVSTALLFEIIREKHLPIRKVVIASSQAVYGEGQYYCASHGLVLPEPRSAEQFESGNWETQCPECKAALVPVLLRETRPNPESPYGISKLAQEQIALRLGGRLGVPTVVLRYAIVQGPRPLERAAGHRICDMFARALDDGNSPVIFEDGKQLRDYIHVSDVVAANVLVLEDPRAEGQTYNVGTGRGTTVLDYARLLMAKMNRQVSLEISGKYREGDYRHSIPSIAKLQTLGWKPNKGLNEIFDDYLSSAGFCGGASDTPSAELNMATVKELDGATH